MTLPICVFSYLNTLALYLLYVWEYGEILIKCSDSVVVFVKHSNTKGQKDCGNTQMHKNMKGQLC